MKLPIKSEPLSVESFDGAWLAGTLDVPEAVPALAITIPVHGSFCQDRNGNVDDTRHWMYPNPVPKRNLFLDFRDCAIKAGTGTYRYDKRASGASEGIWTKTDFNAIAKDLLAVYKVIRARFPGIPVGFMGQSEGATTCLKAIEMGAAPDFFISQGGALDNYLKLLDEQKDRAAKPYLGSEDNESAKQFPLLAAFYRSYFLSDLREKILNTREEIYTLHGVRGWNVKLNINLYRQYDQYEPLEVLRQLGKPSLLLNGTEDLNVSTEALLRVQAEQKKGEFKHATVGLLKGLEHSFRRIEPGLDTFQMMEKPVDPVYLELVTHFLRSIGTA